MNNIQTKIYKFITTYENIFHNDWDYSSEMLSQNLFEEGETFIQCEWVTNWCNKDALDASFKEIKTALENPMRSEASLTEHLQSFLKNIEIVFHSDWEYTKLYLGIETSIAEATFLYPMVDAKALEIENWSYRAMFLQQYYELKDLVR